MGANGEANNEELQALKQEVVIMRDRLEHHPEVKRFAGVPSLAQGLARVASCACTSGSFSSCCLFSCL